MANRLTKIKLNEVSLVDNPAEPNARVAFFKRDTDEKVKRKSVRKGSRFFSMKTREKLSESGAAMPDGSFPIPDVDALRRAILSIGRTTPDKRAAVKAHIIRRAKALNRTDMLPASWAVKKGDGMNIGFLRGLADRLGFEVDDDATLEDIDKAVSEVIDVDDIEKTVVDENGFLPYSVGNTDDNGGNMADADLTAVPAEIVTKIEELERERDELLAKLNELEKGDTENEDVLQKADPEVLEYIHKVQAEAEEAKEIAKAEKEARLAKEYLEKSMNLPYIGEDRQEFADLLKTLSGAVDETVLEKLEGLFKSVNAQLAESELFKEAGMGGGVATGDAEAQIEAIAKKYVNEDTTFEQAYDRVIKEQPELYERYLQEAREG